MRTRRPLLPLRAASGAEGRRVQVAPSGRIFSRALMSCVMCMRVMPEVVRPDKRAEVTSKVNQKFLALCSIKNMKGKGNAYTPRHQGRVERGHQVQLMNHIIY